jgi:hypothetical protein
MKKRYTVTFKPSLIGIDDTLKEIAKLGVEVQSAQLFIGTAIVAANVRQIRKVRALSAIKGITETGTFQVSAN